MIAMFRGIPLCVFVGRVYATPGDFTWLQKALRRLSSR
jgi:hypothetical protein